jgi:hypothetical protein
METRATDRSLISRFWFLLLFVFLIFAGRQLYFRPPGQYNLLTHLHEARVSLRDQNGLQPFDRWIRQQWFPSQTRSRWMRVGRITAPFDAITRDVIWAHPIDDGRLVIEYPRVPWTDEFVFQYGLTDWAAKMDDGAEIHIRVEIEGGRSLEIRQHNERGWHEKRIPTTDLRGKTGRLRLTITTPSDERRHFCLNGFTQPRQRPWIAASLAALRQPGRGWERFGRVATPVLIFMLLLIPAHVFFSRRSEWGLTPRNGWMLVALWLGIFLSYAHISGERLTRHSLAPHHIYQAHAFLRGQLSLPIERPNDIEWVEYDDKQYVSFPPTPALMVLPVVALLGLTVSDALLSVIIAACNGVLLFILLEALAARQWCRLSRPERWWLVALFAFGTVHLSGSKLGGVWFNSQLASMTMATLFVMSIVARWSPLLSGAFLILGILARPPVVFYFPLLAIFLLEKQESNESSGFDSAKFKRLLVQVAVPVIIGAGIQAVLNLARYGSPFQFGYDYLGNEAAARHGFFSFRHLPENLRLALIGLPVFSSTFPFIGFRNYGMSMFLTTPAWFGLFRLRRDMPYKWLCLLATVMVAMVTLVWASTGGQQFGYRYSLDYTILLLLMLALGKERLGPVMKGLIVVSIIINIAGAVWFRPW